MSNFNNIPPYTVAVFNLSLKQIKITSPMKFSKKATVVCLLFVFSNLLFSSFAFSLVLV